MKLRLRNQPDRLPRNQRFELRSLAGICPSCVLARTVDGTQTEINELLAVIYRRSAHSVTFRCQHCSLQWAVTFVSLRRAALVQAALAKNKMLASIYSAVIEDTRGVTEREAARRTSIRRQLDMTTLRKRRVIRL